jgi:hypothetical protein
MAQPQQQRSNPMQDYVTVAERIEKFYERFEQGRIITSIIEHDSERGFILMRAEIYRQPDDAQPASTGHAFEYKDAGFVQKTSYIETCETSCVGRALALLNFETKRGIASREEMEKVNRMRQPLQAVKPVQAEQCEATGKAITVPANDKPAGDGWVCGDALKRQILDLESSAEEFGLYKKMRDALEVSTGSRNPAHASTEKAEGYINYIKAQIKKAQSDRNL